ncbi:MAG: tetratricopeptide repeat protein [Acidobacteria bacterium]|nr:tetratricopeptide repeat protein [Acidobacteriota bacterium]
MATSARRGAVRHQTVGMLEEIFALLRILLQDAVILVAGFAVEFVFERWMHSEQPAFRVALNISSGFFLLLYGVMVTVHFVRYLREQVGTISPGAPGHAGTTGSTSAHGATGSAGSPGTLSSIEPAAQAALRQRYVAVGIGAAAAAALALAIAVGGGLYWNYWRRPALTEKDSILITDFVNTTGDAVFDGALKQGLATNLEQSPFLNIVPEETARQTMLLMNRQPDEPITRTLARDICQRKGIKAILSGSIAPMGNNYVIGLEALNCQTGEPLAREQVEAQGKEQILSALGTAASSLRGKLGETLTSIEKFNAPLAEATTSSLDALKAYSAGVAQVWQGAEVQSIPFFERAIELDPNFALAYWRLAVIYSNAGERERATEYNKKAFDLRDRVSELERYQIIDFKLFVAVELQEALKNQEQWKQAYPREWGAHNQLGNSYRALGQFEKAAEEYREAIRLNPDASVPHGNLAGMYQSLGRYDEAKQTIEQAKVRNLDNVAFYNSLYRLAFVQGDAAAMQRQVEGIKGQPREYTMLSTQAGAATVLGIRKQARELYSRSIELAQARNFKEDAALSAARVALADAHFGNYGATRTEVERALSIMRSAGALCNGAIAMGIAGTTAGATAPAQTLIAEMASRFPQDTYINAICIPAARAALELQRGNAAQAIQMLEAAIPYELGTLVGAAPYAAIYVRGLAYLKLPDGNKAAAEFQKILDHRGVAPTSERYALAHLGLARAWALAPGSNDNAAKARRAYQDFLALWKDADPDIPILIEAKKEYAKLK